MMGSQCTWAECSELKVNGSPLPLQGMLLLNLEQAKAHGQAPKGTDKVLSNASSKSTVPVKWHINLVAHEQFEGTGKC